MKVAWAAAVHLSVAFAAANANLAIVQPQNDNQELPECGTVGGAFESTDMPCISSTHESHFSDAGTDCDQLGRKTVRTCTETPATVAEAAEEEHDAENDSEGQKEHLPGSFWIKFSGLVETVQHIEWEKAPGVVVDLVKEHLITEADAQSLLAEAKQKLKDAADGLYDVEWKEIPRLAKDYALDRIPTEEEARKALAEAKLELQAHADNLRNVDWESLPEDIKKNVLTSIPSKNDARKAFESKKLEWSKFVENLEWKNIPKDLKDHIVEHPGNRALTVARWAPMLFPGLVAGPLAATLGFGGIGPVAGTVATAYQRRYGTGLVFRALQSCAMKGWGVSVVHRAVSATGVLVNGAVEMGRRGKLDDVEDVKGVCVWKQRTVFVQGSSPA